MEAAKRNPRTNSPAKSDSVSSVTNAALQRVIEKLEEPNDDWETFGDFVSVEMRQLSNIDGVLAGLFNDEYNQNQTAKSPRCSRCNDFGHFGYPTTSYRIEQISPEEKAYLRITSFNFFDSSIYYYTLDIFHIQ